MPYWGANVRNGDHVIQAKIHGEAADEPANDELIEFISNLAKYKNVAEKSLAKFFAEKIAVAYTDVDDALWVTVDILTTGGRTFGATKLIKGYTK